MEPIMQFFAYEHLPAHLQEVSRWPEAILRIVECVAGVALVAWVAYLLLGGE